MKIEKYLKKILERFGFKIILLQKNQIKAPGMILNTYLKKDGSFDYKQYLKYQERGNKERIHNVWILEENIVFLSDYIKSKIPFPQFGICHGTRRGKEQEWFKKYLDCEVIGTEIASTAEKFPNTIRWDFHEVKSEWINAVDFIYSNSLDHSYDPEKCLNAWMNCLKNEGICIIEHSSGHEITDKIDPFGASIFIMPYLIITWGKGKFGVKELLVAPKKREGLDYLYFIVIQKF